MFKESGKGTQQKGEIYFDKNSKIQISNIEMKFSHDSKFLAIFIIETGTLRIYKIEDLDICKFFDQISQN